MMISIFEAHVVLVADGDGKLDRPTEIFDTKAAADEFAGKLIRKLNLKVFNAEHIVKVMSVADYFTNIAFNKDGSRDSVLHYD